MSTVRTGGTTSCSLSSTPDAAFARPEIYEALGRRGVRYAIRLPTNDVLERQIEDLLTRPRGRPSHAPLVRYRSFHYQAASWDRPRRVIAKVEHHLGELSSAWASSSPR
jgi:Transposase DDE domain group 1